MIGLVYGPKVVGGMALLYVYQAGGQMLGGYWHHSQMPEFIALAQRHALPHMEVMVEET